MDNEEAECFDVSFVKARAKNVVESNILCKQLKTIDRQYRRSLSRIENDLREEKRFAYKLKRELKEYKKKDKTGKDKAEEKFEAMVKQRKMELAKMQRRAWDTSETVHHVTAEDAKREEDMTLMGEGMTKEIHRQPAMFFWSQDSSTKLPVMTSFYGYGYRVSLNRSMTEVKLLGQQMYPDSKRDVQSADPIAMRHANTAYTEVRRAKTGGNRTRDFDAGGNHSRDFDEDFCYEAVKLAPPPTRENTSLSDIRTASAMRASVNSFLNDAKSRENTMISEPPKVDVKPKKFDRFFSGEPSARERSTLSVDCRPKSFPKVRETTMEKSSPEDINLDLKHENKERLPNISRRSVGTAMGHYRPIKKPSKVLTIKTRGEATKQYQELIGNRSPEQPKLASDQLKRSYSDIPTLMTEINKLQTTIEFLPKGTNGQYSKSAFGMSMQNAISKKVLNKSALPAAFRKNNNTMLKHYGAPFMEVKAVNIVPKPVTVE